MWYAFGQLGSAVLAVSPPSLLCRRIVDSVKALLSSNLNICVLSTLFSSQIWTHNIIWKPVKKNQPKSWQLVKALALFWKYNFLIYSLIYRRILEISNWSFSLIFALDSKFPVRMYLYEYLKWSNSAWANDILRLHDQIVYLSKLTNFSQVKNN